VDAGRHEERLEGYLRIRKAITKRDSRKTRTEPKGNQADKLMSEDLRDQDRGLRKAVRSEKEGGGGNGRPGDGFSLKE